MPNYHLFQIRLDEAQIEAVNNGNDDGVGSDYMQGRLGQVSGAIKRGLHQFTAIVKARNLEDLFHKTNAIDEPWINGPNVLMVVTGAASTSCGDIAVDCENNEAWLCATVGWEALDWGRAARVIIEAKSILTPDDTPQP